MIIRKGLKIVMSTQYQTQTHKKIKVLITGGGGDLASFVSESLGHSFEVFSPKIDELNVASQESVKLYFDKKAFDVVVNLAGTLYSSSVLESEPDKWIRDINVNLIGTYLVSREALISNKNTVIVNVASTAAYNSYSDWTSYCASKAGVLKLSGGLYKDNYYVVTLCPGAIDTKLRNGLMINNPNVMTKEEGAGPIISAVKKHFSSGDIVFYRKKHLEVRKHE